MSLTTLSAKETEILVAILSLMGELPKIDYDELASRVGITYGRNARKSAKKLFEKIKSTSPDEASGAGSAANDDAVPKPAAKKAKTSIHPTTPRKTAGKKPKVVEEGDESEDNGGNARVGQKRKAPTRKTAPTKIQPKTENNEISEFHSEADDYGKFDTSSTSLYTKNTFTNPNSPQKNCIYEASSASHTIPSIEYSDEEEKQDAADRGLTVERWRQWRLENNYDQLF